MTKPTKEEILNTVDEIIVKEKLSFGSKDSAMDDDQVINTSLEVAELSKSILKHLYDEFRKPDSSLPRRVKNLLIGKIANTVRNVMERPLISQQKFNQQILTVIKHLVEENRQLKAKISELEAKNE